MSEADWGSEGQGLAQPPKRRIPGWVWGCGAGCGLCVVVGVLALVVVFKFMQKAFDQEANWERLSAVLPVEQPPSDVHIFGMPFRLEDTSMWVLTDQGRNVQGFVMQAPASEDARQTRGELLDSEGEVHVGGPLAGYGRNQVERGEVEVQGRKLACVRYQAFPERDSGKGSPLGAFGAQFEGASIIVDLAPEGSDELLVLILTKMRTRERVSDDELREFLAPFHIPGGTVQPSAPPAEEPAEEDK